MRTKHFIEVKQKKRSNVYIVQKLDFNPYIILSEMAHSFVEYYFYKSNLRSLDWIDDEPNEDSHQTLKWALNGEQSITSWRQHLVKVFNGIVTDEGIYKKYIESMVITPDQDYVLVNEMFRNELLQELCNKR